MSLSINPLNAELNPICHLLALLGGATVVVVSRLRVNRHSCFVSGVSCILKKGLALAILTECFHGSLQSIRRQSLLCSAVSWPDIVVSSVTGLRAGLLLSRGLNSGRTRKFSLLQNTQTGPRARPHTVQWILASLDPVDKQPGLEAVHSPSYSVQLNSNSFVFVAGTR